MIIKNEDVREIMVEIPSGHTHLRARIIFANGEEMTFQEATVANLVRAFITALTHPQKSAVHLIGQTVADRKEGFAPWRLLEKDDPEIST